LGVRRVPKAVILFEVPSRSPGHFGTGECLGLARGLGRTGVGLAAGRNARFELGRLLPGLNASVLGAGVRPDRCGLADGRCGKAIRALFGLVAGLIATGELMVIGEATPLDCVERSPGDAGTPERAKPTTLLACRGCGLIAGREEALPVLLTGCARGLPEGRALGTDGFEGPPPCIVRAGSVALCAEPGRAAQPRAGGGATGADLIGVGDPLLV